MVKKISTKKARRSTSNIFGMFSQNQLTEFKQAFQFIDFNKDGYIDKEDIVAVFDSLGRNYPNDEITSMITEAGGPINFTTFIRLIGEKIYGDAEDEDLKSALFKFDNKSNGKIDSDLFLKNLCTFGEKLNENEVQSILEFVYVDKQNNIDIDHLIKTLNGNSDD